MRIQTRLVRLRLAVIASISAVLVGCSTYVEHRLSGRADTNQTLTTAFNQFQQEFQLESREFCLPHLGGCTGYLYGVPYHRKAENNGSFNDLKTFVELELDGSEPEHYQLLLKRENVNPRDGTVVLMHGYGMNKSAMGFMATYFMFLGYHVIVPDLMGHGESTIDHVGFGALDAPMFSTLLDSLPQREVPKPYYVAGMSMGGIAATHLAKQRDDIAGLILWAPMLPMEQATVAMLETWYPNLSKVMSMEGIQEGALAAMAKQGVTSADTDIHQLLPELNVPTLILASDNDRIAPYEQFLPLESERVRLELLSGRSHGGVGVMTNDVHQLMVDWLAAQDR